MNSGKLTHSTRNQYGAVGIEDDEPAVFTGHFNMLEWKSTTPDCNTVACIGGTSEMLGAFTFENDERNGWDMPAGLESLFFAYYGDPNVQQAATALENYLHMGDPMWSNVMKENM